VLNDTRIRNAKARERDFKLFDFDGLFLLVRPNGSKLWRLAYRFEGKQKGIALGAYPEVTLAEAVTAATLPASCSRMARTPASNADWRRSPGPPVGIAFARLPRSS
jgi:Arm domain-containing DNA-binding protein